MDPTRAVRQTRPMAEALAEMRGRDDLDPKDAAALAALDDEDDDDDD